MTTPAPTGFTAMLAPNGDIVLQHADAAGKVKTRLTIKAGSDITINAPLVGNPAVTGKRIP